MLTTNVQEIFDAHIAPLTAGERLRLVEMITRSMAELDLPSADALHGEGVPDLPGWQDNDRRGNLNDWRDRTL